MSLTNKEKKLVEKIYQDYSLSYGGYPQGWCNGIAKDILSAIGRGELVAGYIKLATSERPHWWADIDGEIVDPMFDELFACEPYLYHIEAYRGDNIPDNPPGYWDFLAGDIHG